MNHWYVIQTKLHKEWDVTELLRRAGVEVYFPRLITDENRRNLARSGRAFFPRYIFVMTDLDEAEKFHMIKFTRGVSKILCRGQRPVPVPQKIMDVMVEKTTPAGIVLLKDTYKVGDTIRVKRGLLKDLIGVFEKPVPSEGRVQVLLHLLHTQMKARLKWTEIEKMSHSD